MACYFSSCHNLKDCNVIFYDCQTDSTGRFLKTLYIATNKHNYFKALRRSVYTSFMPILQPLLVLDMISKFKVEKPFLKAPLFRLPLHGSFFFVVHGSALLSENKGQCHENLVDLMRLCTQKHTQVFVCGRLLSLILSGHGLCHRSKKSQFSRPKVVDSLLAATVCYQ